MTIAEAAAYLGVSVNTVLNRVRSGELPAERVGKRVLLIPNEAVIAAEAGPRPRGPQKGAKYKKRGE